MPARDLTRIRKFLEKTDPQAKPTQMTPMKDETLKRALEARASLIWGANPKLQDLDELHDEIQRLKRLRYEISRRIPLIVLGTDKIAGVEEEYQEKTERYRSLLEDEGVKREIEKLRGLIAGINTITFMRSHRKER